MLRRIGTRVCCHSRSPRPARTSFASLPAKTPPPSCARESFVLAAQAYATRLRQVRLPTVWRAAPRICPAWLGSEQWRQWGQKAVPNRSAGLNLASDVQWRSCRELRDACALQTAKMHTMIPRIMLFQLPPVLLS
jgi:hypothetical protein